MDGGSNGSKLVPNLKIPPILPFFRNHRMDWFFQIFMWNRNPGYRNEANCIFCCYIYLLIPFYSNVSRYPTEDNTTFFFLSVAKKANPVLLLSLYPRMKLGIAGYGTVTSRPQRFLVCTLEVTVLNPIPIIFSRLINHAKIWKLKDFGCVPANLELARQIYIFQLAISCVHSRGHSFDPIPIIFGRLITHGKIWKLKDFGRIPLNLELGRQIYFFQLVCSLEVTVLSQSQWFLVCALIIVRSRHQSILAFSRVL